MKNKRLEQQKSDESEPTFFEAFQKEISKFEAENPIQYPKQDNNEFTLYEDLKLILELSKVSQIEPQNFERISAHFKRSKMVLKKRYQDYLKNINQDDLQKIFSFLQDHGAYGYLIFTLDNGIYRLKDIEPIKQTGLQNKTPTQTPLKKINQSIKQESSINVQQISIQQKYSERVINNKEFLIYQYMINYDKL